MINSLAVSLCRRVLLLLSEPDFDDTSRLLPCVHFPNFQKSSFLNHSRSIHTIKTFSPAAILTISQSAASINNNSSTVSSATYPSTVVRSTTIAMPTIPYHTIVNVTPTFSIGIFSFCLAILQHLAVHLVKPAHLGFFMMFLLNQTFIWWMVQVSDQMYQKWMFSHFSDIEEFQTMVMSESKDNRKRIEECVKVCEDLGLYSLLHNHSRACKKGCAIRVSNMFLLFGVGRDTELPKGYKARGAREVKGRKGGAAVNTVDGGKKAANGRDGGKKKIELQLSPQAKSDNQTKGTLVAIAQPDVAKPSNTLEVRHSSEVLSSGVAGENTPHRCPERNETLPPTPLKGLVDSENVPQPGDMHPDPAEQKALGADLENISIGQSTSLSIKNDAPEPTVTPPEDGHGRDNRTGQGCEGAKDEDDENETEVLEHKRTNSSAKNGGSQ